MMMPSGLHPLVVLTFLVVTLSGCTDPEPAPTDNEAPSPSANALPALEMHGCLDTGSSMNDPESRERQPIPSGWRYNTFATPLVRYDILVCDRVAIGPYERGDVALLFETNYGPEASESCLNYTKNSRINLINGIWISDAELGEYLSSQLNHSVQTFTMTVEDERDSLPPQMHIFWQIDGITRGDLEFYGTPDDLETTTADRVVYAWETADQGVGLWVMHVEDTDHQGGIVAASGKISSPHWNPNPASDDWLGGASARTSNTSSEIFQFEDSLCEEPL